MALKFLHIGKASARIDELESQVATLTKERDDALKAVESNSSEVTKHAEELQTQLSAANGLVTKLTSDFTAQVAISATQVAEIKSLKEQAATSAASIEIKVARQVAQTQAALGQ